MSNKHKWEGHEGHRVIDHGSGDLWDGALTCLDCAVMCIATKKAAEFISLTFVQSEETDRVASAK